ncbi:MAG: hypothetical protein A2Z68_02260 [Candidatus Nealsonbacteria bacterium RBG_13_38_11]|uniref:Uncharacterized protein n=1 Tax=Candidatus Nealsonbacteria bacterium RBG_13_38_11 TaxID=1801662 RepID=A0A1G2DZ99_9BACT|nr:MAG: hypothetical protein A2Z68_02260 [Candidatus Nealsonbacteria bacterium RBG_13_38_11]HXK32099.1 hypothetical protein [Candidatus Paceibacterota bacterium]
MNVFKVMDEVKGKLFCLFLAITIAVSLGLMWGNYSVKTQEVPVRNEIERAIAVERLDNIVSFKEMKRVMFGGAGAGGLGAGTSQVVTESTEQFLAFIPGNEPVYVAFQKPINAEGDVDQCTIKKVYWAFIENRSGVWVYEDVYNYQEGSLTFKVKEYDDQKVVFVYDPIEENAGYMLWSFFGIVLFGVFLGSGFHKLMPDIRHARRRWSSPTKR